MDIVIHCMGMPFNGETIKTKSLGGSETAAYYQALELAARGHRVNVFTTTHEPGSWDGVNFMNLGNVTAQTPLGEQFEYYARNTPHDVLIIQRHPAAFHNSFASKINIWQLHDLAMFRSAAMSNHGMWQVDAVTAVSSWHKDQIAEVYGFNRKIIFPVPNGVDPDLYAINDHEQVELLKTIEGFETDGFKMLYQSRPERGLEHLVRPGGIMDQLADSEASLYVCGYDNTVPQMRQYYAQLEEWGKKLGNVTFLGALTKPQLAALQMSCDLLVYPTEFKEVSCISAMEAMHAGLPMVTSVVGALPETCQMVEAGVHFIPLLDGKADEEMFVNRIRFYINNELELTKLKAAQLKAANFKTWVKAVDMLECVINTCFDRRRSNTTSVVRHAIEHSDIVFAKSCLEAIDFRNPVLDRSGVELQKLYSFAHNRMEFKRHYELHQTEYYDKFESSVVGEDVSHSTRFRGVAALVGQEMQKHDGKLRMLDYGCAHGHYLMPIAANFKGSRFVGIDVSERAIGAALKWMVKLDLENVTLINGDQTQLDDPKLTNNYDDLFDIVLAGEVLEHVEDYWDLLERLRGVMKPDGLLIITTPQGRWEWTGTEAFRTGREHMHHFDRQDILEICGENPVNIMYAPAGNDKTGRPLGSWVWGVQPRNEFSKVDYERKRSTYAPRQSVSACIIVKDGEKTLRRCVESFIDWVDEVIIGIDGATTDRTEQVIEHLVDDYKWKSFTVFDNVQALNEGFDAARNETIARASCDWILWCDADEEIQQAQNLWKYLRSSQHPAIGFPQVHYSTNPPQVLTTDYPLRLFRNNGAIKFYGLVHEHPETGSGKGVDHATVRHDVQFLHCGYVDEDTRRARFQRNLPLLYRDREVNPDRGLNRYLMLRDVAQGLVFEQEQTQGYVTTDQPVRAEIGVQIFEEMLEKDSVRSVIEALKYYSHCVAVLGRGFESKLHMEFKNDHAPDLNANLDVEGRFHSREFFAKLVSKLHEEATKQYESEYL
jgi:glycosyltransferase involved in cell wall biosynthesis/2-polyprenyl-3-methyl-5-hydroxy-6-metoxy-1,4-benzoquinol methylase